MEFKKEDMIDLNEQNVQQLFAYCLANNSTPAENIIKSNFFRDSSAPNIPDMTFDTSKVLQVNRKISYILGQLNAFHIGTANMSATDGFKKYDGTNWTQNKVALFALYYLADASALLPKFTYYPSLKNFASPLVLNANLVKPTLSPNDPNFKKKSGQEPADD